MEQNRTIWTIETPRALGAALRALREESGLTQQELAEALGTTRQRLSRVEEGELSDQVLLLLRQVRRLGAVVRLERVRS
jgi:transcriptional regulator with XRE-family HTH domain